MVTRRMALLFLRMYMYMHAPRAPPPLHACMPLHACTCTCMHVRAPPPLHACKCTCTCTKSPTSSACCHILLYKSDEMGCLGQISHIKCVDKFYCLAYCMEDGICITMITVEISMCLLGMDWLSIWNQLTQHLKQAHSDDWFQHYLHSHAYNITCFSPCFGQSLPLRPCYWGTTSPWWSPHVVDKEEPHEDTWQAAAEEPHEDTWLQSLKWVRYTQLRMRIMSNADQHA